MPAKRNRQYFVVLMVFLLSLITYIDRVAISSAKTAMANDLSLSDRAMGFVFSAFALGYALAQVPMGWLADRLGPRRALAMVVALWSVFTSLTGAVSRLGSLLFVRTAFGAAEAGAFPGAARVFYNWLAPEQRGIANGILFSGALIGGALAFPLFQWMLGAHGWRNAFYYLGLPGIAWVAVWLLCFRDHPEPPDVSAPRQLEAAESAPAAQWPAGATMAKTMAQYFAQNFTFFICISWMNPYLASRYALGPSDAARFSMVPLLSGAVSNWVSGFLVDWLYKSRRRGWSRRLPATIGFSLAACAVYAVTLLDSPVTAVAAFALATFGVEMTISPSWA